MLDSRLPFSHHIDTVVTKANRMSGLIMRSMQTSCHRRTFYWKPILTAYYANVRTILEYCCVIWGGAARVHLDRLERVQYRFLRWLHYYVHRRTITTRADNPDYSELLQRFDVTCLENRRKQYDIMFVSKVYHRKIDSSELLTCFPLYVTPIARRLTENSRGLM